MNFTGMFFTVSGMIRVTVIVQTQRRFLFLGKEGEGQIVRRLEFCIQTHTQTE